MWQFWINLLTLETITYYQKKSFGDRVELVVGDIADAELVDKFGCQGWCHCSLCGWKPQWQLPLKDPSPFIYTNFVGTYTLLEAARKWHSFPPRVNRRRVWRPSIARRSSWTWGKVPWKSLLKPNTTYHPLIHQPRLFQTWLWLRVRSLWIVKATISNCSNNYGPYQHIEKFIPRQITNILSGIKPKLYGEGKTSVTGSHFQRPLNWRVFGGSLLKAVSVKHTLIALTVEKNNKEGFLNWSLKKWDQPKRRLRPCNRPCWSRFALRHRFNQLRGRIGLEPQFTNFEAGLEDTIKINTDHQDWWKAWKRSCRSQLRENTKVLK